MLNRMERFMPIKKKHGSKFTLTILAAALLVTFHTTTIASTTLASSTTPPLPGQSTVTLTYSATGAKVVYDSSMKNPTRSGSPYLFLTEETSKDAVLSVVVNGKNLSYNQAPYQFYIIGGFRSVYLDNNEGTDPPPSVNNKFYLNDGIVSLQGSNGQDFNYSTYCSGATVDLTFTKDSSFYSVIYGSRNDISDFNKPLATRVENVGDSNSNTVKIDLREEGALWRGTLIMGGRSAQAEGLSLNNQKGYSTNFNKVEVKGRNSDKDHSVNLQFKAGGLWGAEGWEASNNLVLLDSVVIQSQSNKTRKLGIVGGRGFFDYRIYDTKGKDDPDSINNTIANGNVVLIKNTIISDPNSLTGASGSVEGMSVFGGYSYGKAANNIVSASNSKINGNVIGGLEMQGVYSLQKGDKPRDLHANLVSLHNVVLTDGAIYGASTAVSDLKKGTSDRVDEEKIQAVNRRRGIAYLAGAVEADSAYVRYLHFGQYYDESYLERNFKNELDLSADYQHENNAFNSLKTPVINKTGLIYTSQDSSSSESMKLGQLVGGSYLLNRKGFHSSLASSDKNSQSDFTNGMHNFWVAAYTVLSDKVNANGRFIQYSPDETKLFTDKAVNHYYGANGEEHLSLLVHDNGLVFDRSADSKTWTDAFRDEYRGLVLYLAVNDGTDGKNQIQAVNISRPAIQIYRHENQQDTFAYGNTQIFVGKVGDEKYSTKTPMGSLTQPSDNFEDFFFTINGFDIEQNGKNVAKATYGFYKYLHVDGKFNPNAEVKVTHNVENGTDLFGNEIKNWESTVKGQTTTQLGDAGGVGIKYWLKSLEVLPGAQLILYGKTNETDVKDENFTLSAELTGSGGIVIPEGNTVIIGDALNRYTHGVNSFSGETTIESNGVLIQKVDGSLGNAVEDPFSQKVEEAKRGRYTSSLNLQGIYQLTASQSVGRFNSFEGSVLELTKVDSVSGSLSVRNGAVVRGNIRGDKQSRIKILGYTADIYTANPEYYGEFVLDSAIGRLEEQNSLQNALAIVSKNSSLYFNSASASFSRDVDPRSVANIRALQNAGDVFLSGSEDKVSNLNHVKVAENYVGESGSVLHYRGLVQGSNNSFVDVIHSETASGTSKVSFGDDHSKIPVSGIFKEARGEKTLKSEGIPIFVIADKGLEGNQLRLEMQPFGVVAKDNEAYKWIYSLGYNDEEQQRTWVLYNSDDKDYYEPLVPPKEEENLVLRPEAGAYVGASQSWAKMHMRLHDRFGQAYYIDPFDGEEKPAAAWVRQVGSHSHFRMAGGQSKTHSNTAVTQIGGDLLRNEFNEDWKYIGGVFAGGLYNRSDSRSWDSAKSRSDGYSLGIYGTLYTGNSPDDGFYVDSWLLFGRYDNKIWSDEISPFKFKSHGWVWSVETGYTIPIGESGTKDYNKLIWTFQPEAQLVWDGVKANSANDSFGTKYRQLGTDNVTLRVGARLHANYMNKGLGFIEGNWIHNSKKAGVQMGTDKVYMDGGRNLGEFRMGLEGHLSRNTLGWATVGVQAGKSGYHNETAQIGIKYMF